MGGDRAQRTGALVRLKEELVFFENLKDWKL